MTIINSKNPKLTKGDIKKWEKKSKINIPTSYQQFLLTNNGGNPLKAYFQTEKYGKQSIDEFFSIGGKELYTLDCAFKFFKEVVELGYFPIAQESAGGLILMDTSCGIHFWDHSTPIAKDEIVYVSDSLESFLESLEEEPVDFYGDMIELIDNGSKEDIISFVNQLDDINQSLEIGGTLVERAALLGKNWLLEILIDRKANLKGGLYQALTLNNIEGFKMLIDAGANINEFNNMGNPLLSELVISNKIEFLKILLGKKDKDVDFLWKNEFGRTALDIANKKLSREEKGMEEIVKLLKPYYK